MVAARNGVIIPVQCEYLALEGLGQLTNTLNRVQRSVPRSAHPRGDSNMYDTRTRLAQDVVVEVRKYFPDKVFHSIIPRSIRLAEAPSYGMPILFHSPESAAAQAYSALAREILVGDGIQIPELEKE